jgi:hypothetical protein
VYNDEAHTFDEAIAALKRAVPKATDAAARQLANIIDGHGRAVVLVSKSREASAAAAEALVLDRFQAEAVVARVPVHQQLALGVLHVLTTWQQQSDGLRRLICASLVDDPRVFLAAPTTSTDSAAEATATATAATATASTATAGDAVEISVQQALAKGMPLALLMSSPDLAQGAAPASFCEQFLVNFVPLWKDARAAVRSVLLSGLLLESDLKRTLALLFTRQYVMWLLVWLRGGFPRQLYIP